MKLVCQLSHLNHGIPKEKNRDSRNLEVSTNHPSAFSNPPVGKYSPSYNQVFVSPLGNTKFKPLSPRNSERFPYNSFVRTYHAEGNFNQINKDNCKRCKQLNQKHCSNKRKHGMNLISKFKKNKKDLFRTPIKASKDEFMKKNSPSKYEKLNLKDPERDDSK